LEILEVPRGDVLDDYALSSKLVDFEAVLRDDPHSTIGVGQDSISMMRLKPHVRRPMLMSDPAYLEQFLAQAAARCGSVQSYIQNEIGVSEATLSGIRRRLVTRP
jgi:hypothetical protein